MIHNYPTAVPAICLFFGGFLGFAISLPVEWCFGLGFTFMFTGFILMKSMDSFKRRASIRLTTGALLFLLLGAGMFRMNDHRYADLNRFAGDEETFSVHVCQTGKSGSGYQMLIVDVRAVAGNGEVIPVSGKILLRIGELTESVLVDDELIVNGQLVPIQNAGNPGEFDAESYYLGKGVLYRMFVSGFQVERFAHTTTLNGWFTHWRNKLATLMEEHLTGDFLAISKALILGDKSNLDVETMEAFSNTGSMHVLAVSGLHVGLLLVILNAVLAKFSRFFTKKTALIVSIVLIWLYGFLTGAGPSVMRAVFMFTVVAMGTLFHRKTSGLNALFITGIVLFFTDPWVGFDIGFQLSFAAMLGIFLVYPRIQNFIIPNGKWSRWFWEGTAVGIAATILTTPLTLFWFYQFPNYFLLANIGVMVFGFFVLLFGLMFLLSAAVPVLSTVVAVIFSFSIVGLLVWVRWVDTLPGAVSSGFHVSIYGLIAAYGLIFLWLIGKTNRYWKIGLVTGTIVLFTAASLGRYSVLSTNEMIIFNTNELTIVLKSEKVALAFYEPRFGHARKIPPVLKSYERYMGTKLIAKELETDVSFRFNGKNYVLSRESDGWKICGGKRKLFFQQHGLPLQESTEHILNTRLKSFLNPEKRQKCCRIEI